MAEKLILVNLEDIEKCRCCGAEIAQIEGAPRERICSDCDDSE